MGRPSPGSGTLTPSPSSDVISAMEAVEGVVTSRKKTPPGQVDYTLPKSKIVLQNIN